MMMTPRRSASSPGSPDGQLFFEGADVVFPEFLDMTGYPGLLNGQRDPSRLQALKPMCLFMHVGDQDGPWLTAMQEQAGNMRRQGFKIQYAVEKNQVHRLRAQEINLSPRLFDQIESCR